jgi:hypothetical protein
VPAIKLDVDTETYGRLVERAVICRRPIDWQAEVELRQALGLPFPREADGNAQSRNHADKAAALGVHK